MNFNGSGITSANPEEYGPPLPTSNTAHELTRWCPHGVRKYLTSIPKNAPLTDAPAVVLEWMEDQGMTRIPRKGHNAGQTVLSTAGQSVWKSLTSRLAGKSA